MRRPHRQAHRLIWPILSVLVLLLVVAALSVRPSAGDHRAMPGKETQP